MKKAIIRRMNEAEAVFLPCFDMTLTDLNEFSVNQCKMTQTWHTVSISSNEKEFSVTWNGTLNTDVYDNLICFITIPEHITVSAEAIIENEKKEIFSNISGSSDGPIEPVGKVGKNKDVEKLTLKFSVNGGAFANNSASLSWIGLQCSDKLDELLKPSPYNEKSWDEYINYNVVPTCRDNVLFSEAEINQIAKKIKQPEFKAIADLMYKQATDSEDFTPEAQIGRYLPMHKGLYRYTRVRDRNRIVMQSRIVILAVAGYLFNERKWSHLAARTLMSIVKTPNWFEGPQCDLEGSTWHHVCFTEQAVVQAIFFSLGFLGGMFTQKAIEEIKVAVFKHYKTIVKCCKEQGYRKFSNQGMVESAGRMIGACGLYKLGLEECLSEIEDCYKEHSSLIANYINEENHCFEGPAYYQYSMTESAYLWKAYSKHMNVSIDKVIPKAVVNSLDYLDCVTSTSGCYGKLLSLNNTSHTNLSDVFLALYASIYDWNSGKQMRNNRLSSSEDIAKNANPIANLMLINYYDDNVKTNAERANKWYIFEKSGLGCFESENFKFWFCAERNPQTGHYHRDRGSVILEHNGNILLADPGMGNYSSWMSAYMGNQEYHNLAHPEKIKMKVQSDIAAISADEAGIGCRTVVSREDFIHPSTRINYITKTENGILFSAELDELYEGVTYAKREGSFVQLGKSAELLLVDEWELEDEMPLWINFLSYGKWQIEKNTATVYVNDSKLSLSFESDEDFTLNAEEKFADYAAKELYILRLKTASNKKHKVIIQGVVM